MSPFIPIPVLNWVINYTVTLNITLTLTELFVTSTCLVGQAFIPSSEGAGRRGICGLSLMLA